MLDLVSLLTKNPIAAPYTRPIVLCLLFLPFYAVNTQIWKRTPTAYVREKVFSTADKIYEEYIASVQLFIDNGSLQTTFNYPITPIAQPFPLVLQFDQFGDEAYYYQAKIIHCNADWTPSNYRAIQYLTAYNVFDLNDFEFSYSTKIPYINYQFQLPKVKLPGNYLVKVYHKDDVDDLVLTKRFVVYDRQVKINAGFGRIIGNLNFQKYQQINFEIDYSDIASVNISTNIKVVVRQNFRWDNASYDLKPQIIHIATEKLVYNQFDLENAFKAGNEFRKIDFSSMEGGVNLQRILYAPDVNNILLYMDYRRDDKTFNQQQRNDWNGYFVINSLGGDPRFSADYALVTFRLKLPKLTDKAVYVMGGFSNFNLLLANKMVYSVEDHMYQATLLLKQGIYDYWYSTKNIYTDQRDDYAVEGSFRLAENVYDILVYYRPLGAGGDHVVGYKPFVSR